HRCLSERRRLGESAASLLPLAPSSTSAAWAARGFAVAVTVGLVGVNAAGWPCWQLLLAAVLDFLLGSFANWRHPVGFAGYSAGVLSNNTFPPSNHGYHVDNDSICAIRSANIPLGSLCAIGASCLLYLTFAMVLGATCYRQALLTDYAIAQKVSLLGRYSCAASTLARLAPPLSVACPRACRILSAIAADTKLAFMEPLAVRKFSVQVPVYSLLTVASISLLFILIGNVNLLGPIVAMPFLLTYAAVNYAYFALAMSFDLEQPQAFRRRKSVTTAAARPETAGDLAGNRQRALSRSSDLDKLFPAERRRNGSAASVKSSASPDKQQQAVPPSPSAILDKSTLATPALATVGSLATAIACLAVMFATRWEYALAAVLLLAALHLYLGRAYPGAAPGITASVLLDRLADRLG
uniref:AA_permease domain-containing protein n=1 Tax=Macrostomum lignano TaxID=282301 RepID=A0A1I8FDK6_9PLAT